MTIKIPKPKASSNKSQTTPQKLHESITKPPGAHPDPKALIPFVDRISVVLTPPEETEAADICEAVLAQTQDKDVFKTASLSGSSKANQRAWRVGINTQLNAKKWPFFKWNTTKKPNS